MGLVARSPITLCIDQALYILILEQGHNRLDIPCLYWSQQYFQEGSKLQNEGRGISHSLNIRPVVTTDIRHILHTLEGAISAADMAQFSLLLLIMVAKDAKTPLKIIASTALLNFIGDALLRVWPSQMGCRGVAGCGDQTQGNEANPKLKVSNAKEC